MPEIRRSVMNIRLRAKRFETRKEQPWSNPVLVEHDPAQTDSFKAYDGFSSLHPNIAAPQCTPCRRLDKRLCKVPLTTKEAPWHGA